MLLIVEADASTLKAPDIDTHPVPPVQVAKSSPRLSSSLFVLSLFKFGSVLPHPLPSNKIDSAPILPNVRVNMSEPP